MTNITREMSSAKVAQLCIATGIGDPTPGPTQKMIDKACKWRDQIDRSEDNDGWVSRNSIVVRLKFGHWNRRDVPAAIAELLVALRAELDATGCWPITPALMDGVANADLLPEINRNHPAGLSQWRVYIQPKAYRRVLAKTASEAAAYVARKSGVPVAAVRKVVMVGHG